MPLTYFIVAVICFLIGLYFGNDRQRHKFRNWLARRIEVKEK